MEVKPLQALKQYSPNEVTDEGIVMEVKPLQPVKQCPPNDVTDEGIVMEVKLHNNQRSTHPPKK